MSTTRWVVVLKGAYRVGWSGSGPVAQEHYGLALSGPINTVGWRSEVMKHLNT